MPIIRRTQPRSLLNKPSYAFASTAARLADSGLTPSQVDQAHPPRAAIRGAGHAPGGNRLSAQARAIAGAAAAINTGLLTNGRVPQLRSPVGRTTAASAHGGGSHGGGTAGGHGGGGHR
jgi:hypothetical protein